MHASIFPQTFLLLPPMECNVTVLLLLHGHHQSKLVSNKHTSNKSSEKLGTNLTERSSDAGREAETRACKDCGRTFPDRIRPASERTPVKPSQKHGHVRSARRAAAIATTGPGMRQAINSWPAATPSVPFQRTPRPPVRGPTHSPSRRDARPAGSGKPATVALEPTRARGGPDPAAVRSRAGGPLCACTRRASPCMSQARSATVHSYS